MSNDSSIFKSSSQQGFHLFKVAQWLKIEMHLAMFFFFLAMQIVLTMFLNYHMYKGFWTGAWNAFCHYCSALELRNACYVIRDSVRHVFQPVPILGGCLVWLGYPMCLRYFSRRADVEHQTLHIRGPQLIDKKALVMAAGTAGKGDISIGGIPIPREIETRHFLAIGKTGCGKTNAYAQAIDCLAKTGGKAIIYDVKGEFVGKFYDSRRDLIFNPLDTRGIRWNVFNEVRTRTDIEALAGSLIPEAKGTNEEWWNEAARDVLIGLLHYTWQKPETRNMTALWENITASGPEKAQMLGSIPEGARGLSYVAEGNNNQAKGVYGKLMQYAKSFEYLQGDMGSDFSISRWLTHPEGRFIFLSNYSDLQDTLRPVLSLFIDFMGKRILAMPDDRNRRLYFFVDEVATLNRLPSLVNLLTLSRSKGGSVWISTQDVGRLDQVYNQNIRQSIINSAGNKLFFAAGDNVTADHLSRITGQHTVSKPALSAMISVSNERDSQSFQRREEQEDLVTASEYLYMPTMECVLILVDQNPARIEMQYVAHPERNPAIQLRSDLDMGKLVREE